MTTLSDDAQRVMSAGSTGDRGRSDGGGHCSYASALGYEIEPAKLSPWLTLLAVVFFEIGASASLIVCAALSTGDIEKPSPVAKGRKRAKPLGEVLAKIKAAGGQLEGSIGAIGRRLGLSKSAAHRALHTLAGLGAVSLATSAAGALVQLR